MTQSRVAYGQYLSEETTQEEVSCRVDVLHHGE